jgi:hypothetical protein
VITGLEAPGDAQRARELGANAFLNKPVLFRKTVELAQQLRDKWLWVERPTGAGEEPRHAVQR